ncbi:cytochrome c biogenesis protein [Acidobacteria bacterium AH-259-D05]|nr:cytochrome c biogenesis protein [Acidobacteria bacterium AH-259-D05]
MSSPINQSSLKLARVSLRVADWLLIPLYVSVILALYGALLYAPTEREMGEVQRIFYFHMGAAWNAFLAFFGVFVAGLVYLISRRPSWDQLAAACAEIGVIFTAIVLVTGSIWAKPVWNTWWAWGDPRVMTTTVLWLIYIAYLILRSSLPEGEQKYKYCAVFGIIGFLDVPIVWISIRWWRTIHPVVITSSGAELETEMIHALIVSMISITVLCVTLVVLRTAMRLNSSMTDQVFQQLMERRVDAT